MKCFVIMPFGNPNVNPEHARKLELIYTQWIKPTVESIKLTDGESIKCHRADKETHPGEIISHIIENLITSDIVIADLSGRNPNVFYELGVRHAVNNKTILMAEDSDDIPFDLQGLRAIVYRYEPEHMLKLKSSLEETIDKILKDPDRIDNPVRRFLYEKEIDKLIKQPTPPGYDVFKNIISEMNSLKMEVNNQISEVLNILKLITSSEEAVAENIPLESPKLEFFEGIWKNEETGSMYYARMIDGELYMPYCYGGDTELTAHYYNFRLIGKTLFGRFKWFNRIISGYFYLQVVSKDKLVGGWWEAEDLSTEILRDISRLNASVPSMIESTMHRDTEEKQFPFWAEEYFKWGLYKEEV